MSLLALSCTEGGCDAAAGLEAEAAVEVAGAFTSVSLFESKPYKQKNESLSFKQKNRFGVSDSALPD